MNDQFPRCVTCRYWRRITDRLNPPAPEPEGTCERRGKPPYNDSLMQTEDPYVAIETHETFGCVEHEEKENTDV